tara:strand:+ start:26470 stop:26916 length:447 start_codon:yes stop_codon:yes gene_type:complete
MNIGEIEFIGFTEIEFREFIREVVIEEISKSKVSNRGKINKKQNSDIKRVREYWDEIASLPNKRLFNSDKLNILVNIEEYGIDKVFDSIDMIWSSPLMKGKNQYQKHVQSLGWCMKPESISKILDGVYSKDKGGFKNNEFKSDDNGFD